MEKMHAVGMVNDKQGAYFFDVPKPQITEDGQVRVKTLLAGVDATDRSMIKYDKKDLETGSDRIIIGHEALGIVEEIGKGVTNLKKGDLVVPTVRRGCGECVPCLHNQSDMCFTGRYRERGLHKIDGFFAPYFVEAEENLVKVGPGIKEIAVLVEPFSIVEKAIEQIRHIQGRLPWACDHPEHTYEKDSWGHCKKAVVIGAGPIGFAATALLRLAGVDTYVIEIVPEDSIKVQLIKELGAHYLNAKGKKNTEILPTGLNIDIMFEASGASELALNIIPQMTRNSIIVLTGISRGESNLCFDANMLLTQIVRFNQVIAGSVNGNRTHFEMSIADMAKIEKKYPSVLRRSITHRFALFDFEKAIFNNDQNQLKTVFDFEKYPEEVKA